MPGRVRRVGESDEGKREVNPSPLIKLESPDLLGGGPRRGLHDQRGEGGSLVLRVLRSLARPSRSAHTLEDWRNWAQFAAEVVCTVQRKTSIAAGSTPSSRAFRARQGV